MNGKFGYEVKAWTFYALVSELRLTDEYGPSWRVLAASCQFGGRLTYPGIGGKLPGDDADLCRIAELGEELFAIFPGSPKARTSATPILATVPQMVVTCVGLNSPSILADSVYVTRSASESSCCR